MGRGTAESCKAPPPPSQDEIARVPPTPPLEREARLTPPGVEAVRLTLAERRSREYHSALGARIYRLQRREHEQEIKELEERAIQKERCCITAPLCCVVAPIWLLFRICCPAQRACDWFEGYLWWLKGGGERPESPPAYQSEEGSGPSPV